MQPTPALLYSEVIIFCIMVLLMILVKIYKSVDFSKTKRSFIIILLSLTALMISDLVWNLIETDTVEASLAANYVANIIYFIAGGVSAFLWFLHSEREQQSALVKTKRGRILCSIPLLLLVVATVASVWFSLIFYIDPQNMYHRGTLYFLHPLVTFGYLLFTSIKAFLLAEKKENYVKRGEYRNLASFAVMPILFGLFQIAFIGLPLLCMGLTLGILMVYTKYQELKISLDSLTQTNNRNRMIEYLSSRMKNTEDRRNLYLFMIDVDHFKQINDVYGHVEGDGALIRVATALKKVCSRHNCFVARYGGDEFVMIRETSDKSEPDRICAEIIRSLNEENLGAHAPYELSVSVGYARCSDNMMFIPEFIKEADQNLYASKEHLRKEGKK